MTNDRHGWNVFRHCCINSFLFHSLTLFIYPCCDHKLAYEETTRSIDQFHLMISSEIIIRRKTMSITICWMTCANKKMLSNIFHGDISYLIDG